jgi:hypothetical protein
MSDHKTTPAPPLLERNMSTPESRAYWEGVERRRAERATWPDWKRAGITVASEHWAQLRAADARSARRFEGL